LCTYLGAWKVISANYFACVRATREFGRACTAPKGE
jgi:hypothetical protein